MAKSKLRQWLEWAAHAETIYTIFQIEFVRTLLLPVIVGFATVISGYIAGVPVMWILMATALAFAGTIHGLLRGSEYIERKNPRGKLRFISSAVGLDLVPLAEPSRAQRRAGGHQALPQRYIDRIQVGVEVTNEATFPISVILEYAESEVEDITPPRTQYPKPAIAVPPRVTMRLMDERMSMNNMPCHNLVGRYEIRLKYGLPGKERFEFNQAASLEIHLHRFGIVTQIVSAPQAIGTL